MNCNTKRQNVIEEVFCKEKYSFSVDWLNVRLDSDNLMDVLTAICKAVPEMNIRNFVSRGKGVCFYPHGCYYELCGCSSITFSYTLDENNNIIRYGSKRGDLYGIFVSISGDGCRYIESLHKNAFLDFCIALSQFNPNCSRIDVACDIFEKNNLLVPMFQEFSEYAFDRDNCTIDFNCGLNRTYKDKEGNIRYRQWVTCDLVFDSFEQAYTKNITIGGHDCKKGTVQLYNKRVEIENGRLKEYAPYIFDSVSCTDYWWRLEYRCKSFANKVWQTLIESKNIYQTFLCAIENMGNFVIPVYDSKHINKAETYPTWLMFLKFLERLIGDKLFILYNSIVNTPYVGTELERVKRYHKECISSNDAVHWLRMCLDKQYCDEMLRHYMYELKFNPKCKRAQEELFSKYSYKLTETVDLYWEQYVMQF